ncbi:MAG: hypothetical protein QGG40_00555 [Myxococcota bacterium]|nr:hypothetical protein [Myxococcota bacterium]
MRPLFVLTCSVWLFGCASDPECAGDELVVEVCAECGDAGGCDRYANECRQNCEADEDCADGETCQAFEEGSACEVEYGCD